MPDLNFTLGSLHADRRSRSSLSIRISRHAHASRSDSMRIAAFLAGESQQHAGVLVGAGLVLPDRAENAAGSLRVLLRGVQGLEDPGQSVDSEVEQGAASEVGVDHAVRVGEGVFGGHGHAEVGGGAVDGAELARGDGVADVD